MCRDEDLMRNWRRADMGDSVGTAIDRSAFNLVLEELSIPCRHDESEPHFLWVTDIHSNIRSVFGDQEPLSVQIVRRIDNVGDEP